MTPPTPRPGPTGDVLPAEASGATALVAQGEALIRVENETMLRVAIERPRDEARVLEAALKELDLVPEEAALAYYSIPYRERGDDTRDRTVHVEGPSIKAALALARRWGNCTPKVLLLAEDAAAWNFAGVFVDYETSFRIERPFQQPKTLRRRDGTVQVMAGRQLDAAYQAGVSKAMRNAILAGLPAFVVARYFTRAKALVAASIKTPDILKAFGALEVSQAMLERHLALPIDAWTPEDVATLRGVYTAIKDGATTVADAFPPGTAEAAALDAPGRPTVVTPESLLAGTVRAEEGADPTQRPDDQPAAAPEGMDRSLILSIINTLRSTVPPAVWTHVLRQHRVGIDTLGRVDLAVLEELVTDLRAVVATTPPRGRGARP